MSCSCEKLSNLLISLVWGRPGSWVLGFSCIGRVVLKTVIFLLERWLPFSGKPPGMWGYFEPGRLAAADKQGLSRDCFLVWLGVNWV